jgi:hypothetical protein
VRKKDARTVIRDLSATGSELANEQLAMVVGGLQPKCGGETPYEKKTETLNGQGQYDSQTDCTSQKQT